MSGEQAERSRRVRRHRWIWPLILVVVGVGAFVTVTSLYDAEGGLRSTGGVDAETTSGLAVVVSPVTVNPGLNTSTVRLTLYTLDDALLDDSGRLGQNTRVTVVTDAGVVESRFPAGTVPLAVEAQLGMTGEQSLYPFDEHEGGLVVLVDSYGIDADGTVVSKEEIPTGLLAEGGVGGWSTSMVLSDGQSTAPTATIAYDRAFSTQAFAILILAAATALALMGLVIGILVKTQRRRIEATMLSWGAALLFALPAMRNFMPNSPPIGVAIDIYVYLWVMLAAVTGAVLLAIAWIERDRAPREASTDAA